MQWKREPRWGRRGDQRDKVWKGPTLLFLALKMGGKEPIAKNCEWLPEAENNSSDSQQGYGSLSLTTVWSRILPKLEQAWKWIYPKPPKGMQYSQHLDFDLLKHGAENQLRHIMLGLLNYRSVRSQMGIVVSQYICGNLLCQQYIYIILYIYSRIYHFQ